METLSVTKFSIKGKNLYVKLNWKENYTELFDIKIYDGDHTWSGRFSNNFAEKYREGVKESKAEYSNNVKIALTRKSDVYTYDFVLVPGETDSATFSWKKNYKGSSMVRVHGSTPVHQEDTTNSKEILIDFLLNENIDLRQTITGLSVKKDELSEDLEKCKNELTTFINLKTSLESTLYEKFLHLLEAKKKRIKHLEENFKNMNEPDLLDNTID